MALQLASCKRMLTRNLNKIETLMTRFKNEQLENIRWEEEEISPCFAKNSRRRLEEGLGALEAYISKIETLLHDYTSLMEQTETPSDKESKDFEDYSAKTESILGNAMDYTALLQARLRALKGDILVQHHSAESRPEPALKTTKVDLPTLPIPNFSGNIWEWDNFWSLFDANVHSQAIPDFFKFNYLLQALKGNAYNAVKKYHVTAENYHKAVEFLKKKYGSSEELINSLLDRMESLTMRSQSMKDQRILLEQLQVITEQLQMKGEYVDSQWFVKQVLTKFTVDVQRKVLERKQFSKGDRILDMETLYTLLDEVISNEEAVALYTKTAWQPSESRTEKRQKLLMLKSRVLCMYCAGDHKSVTCTKYKTAQERSQYLRDHKLCLICASSKHTTKECKKRMCFKCQGPHHTSCCFKGSAKEEVSQSAQKVPRKGVVANVGKKAPGLTTTRKVNHLVEEKLDQQDVSVLELQSGQENMNRQVYLPTGELTIMNPITRELRKVAVLLDTGAELSFIEQALVENLGLPTLEETTLRLRTFGSTEVQERKSSKVLLEVWDNEGKPFTLTLLTSEVLTKACSPPPLLEEDLEFINSLGIKVNLKNRGGKPAVPQVLLGCDQLWSLMCEREQHIRLPSGLYILPTRLGHLLSGQVQATRQSEQIQRGRPIENWEAISSISTQAHPVMVHSFGEDHELTEEELFTRFCTLESSGTEEFSNAESNVRSEIDQQVWSNFINTVEKREDGYYVRLPWKEQGMELPDNKAIAFKRLLSLCNSLKKDKDLFQRYDKVFQEQLSLNIIEKVDREEESVGHRIHYIPHQMVLTPHKATTKLRVVFDASAHFRDCPSLNDMLHRGPVILPKLYGLILRFRIGQFALRADVEKAFLQVRLHEEDRDATRCLWLRNYKLPPDKENIQVYRFTRITFGLLPSPFLLAATTHYHLDQYSNDTALVAQIKENLYVDNLLLTMDTAPEAISAYMRTKEIFNDLQMNLREFVTNESAVAEAMNDRDKSAEGRPKVLGIRWEPIGDKFEIFCHITSAKADQLTKRAVASAVASIYDPMGWLAPLMHRAKRFLQSLWKARYEWDTKLNQQKEEEWNEICADIDGFQISIPRYLGKKSSKAALLVFADASTEAIAACAYLQTEGTCNLLMAKTKLPSLKVKSTVPKMELNAMTLAVRLTNSILDQIRSTISIELVSLLSDSEIALGWVTTKLRHDVGPFVKNRVMEIHRIINHLIGKGYKLKIGHIVSASNPADCATRGLDKIALTEHFWWSGPTLTSDEIKWYSFATEAENGGEETTANSEQVTYTIRRAEHRKEDIFFKLQRFPFSVIKRIVARVIRFINILAIRIRQRHGASLELSVMFCELSPITQETLRGREIAAAKTLIIKQHQLSHITQEIVKALDNLNIQLDKYGVLRCFGRMGKSCLDDPAKYPMLVLQNTWLSRKIIEDCHMRNHPGISHTMAKVRELYWIPKLRAQVTKALRQCIACQKYNNLPFKYPEQGNLPSRRVQKCRPFAHVGLDYFGPLQVAGADGDLEKGYGCILTCLVTRLVHLDIVRDMSTVAFLRMLRRFFSRRGTPQTITCDNAPTFTLGETILTEMYERAKKDETLSKELSIREIEWKYITPYAPWQGGVYERLIKSVKVALFKTLGKTVLPYEELLTVIIEIEALLNTRPLTYVESGGNIEQVLRPIDFIQNEFECPIPMDLSKDENEDATYMTHEERQILRTKMEVIRSQQSSCALTERFWNLWKTQYLTSLRETHQRRAVKQRGSSYVPEIGKLVLVNDPMQPRHVWKMGRIEELQKNAEGVVREATIRLASHRRIRRPLNLLTPLELDESPAATPPEQSDAENRNDREHSTPSESHYDLRPRRPVNYRETDVSLSHIGPLMITTMVALSLVSSSVAADKVPTHFRNSSTHFVRCLQGGVELISHDQGPYEVCAEDFCMTVWNPRVEEKIKFPVAVTLQEHTVQWKLLQDSLVKVIKTRCPPAPFCENIDCTFCTTLLFNPHCWPMGAIMVATLMTYFLITGCYVFLYVPVTMGRPLRILSGGLINIIRGSIKGFIRLINRKGDGLGGRKKTDISLLLAIVGLIATPTLEGCQLVSVLPHQSEVCRETRGKHGCTIQVSEVLKINPFRKEACLHLMRNETAVHRVRVSWMNLRLTCERDIELFTRDAIFHVVDSKRCPHTGSCVGKKCARINSSSLIPELEEGNQYPGITACVESCGGPGCDCFYWSSGCLFYRIYLKPSSPKVYEIFKCIRWRESAKIKVTHIDAFRQRTNSFVIDLKPNIPSKIDAMTLTLSSVTIPPLPLLSTRFISDGTSMALWNPNTIPPLQCESEAAAQNLSCDVVEDCECYPAETKANCRCKNVNISEWFQNVENHLPIILPALSFRRHNKEVQAIIPTMTTAEIILNIQDQLQTRVLVEDVLCTVQDTTITGCYNCAKGARAQIVCTSARPAQAEITCEQFSFTVPCDSSGIASPLRFSMSNARIHIKCSASCGKRPSNFEVTGVLQFTHTINTLWDHWIKGKSRESSDFHWPDIFHIADVFWQWYKTLLLSVGLLCALLAITYLYISTCGLRCLWIVLRLAIRRLSQFFRALLCYRWRYFVRVEHNVDRKTL